MKADVARTISDSYTETVENLDRIFDAIEKAAKDGLYYILWDHLSKEAIRMLITKGYMIDTAEYGRQYIRWEHVCV